MDKESGKMYRGDGSYNTSRLGYERETSLKELINREHEMVERYNMILAAYETADRNAMNTLKYKDDLRESMNNIDKARQAIVNCINAMENNIINNACEQKAGQLSLYDL